MSNKEIYILNMLNALKSDLVNLDSMVDSMAVNTLEDDKLKLKHNMGNIQQGVVTIISAVKDVK